MESKWSDPGSGDEGVAEFEVAVAGAGVHVFGVEDGGAGTDGGFYR